MERKCICGEHEKTKVSVVVPTYNGEKFIDRCLDSLFSQTYKCVEIICVNDGSADNSSEIFKGYGERIKLIDKPNNQGVWKACETGFSHASGEYICLCDIDDTVESNWLEVLVGQIEKTDADIAVCGYRRISAVTGKVLAEEMTKFGEACYDLPCDIAQLLSVNYSLWNKIYKKKLLENIIKFGENPTVSNDLLLNVSIYPSISRISLSPEICYNYYIYEGFTNNSVTDERYSLLKDRFLELKELYNSLNLNHVWHEYLSLIAFILFSVFIPARIGENKENNLRFFVKDAKKYMDENFPLWRKPEVFRLRNLLKNRQLSKLYISWVFSKLGLMVLFIKTYNFVLRTLKIEIKW